MVKRRISLRAQINQYIKLQASDEKSEFQIFNNLKRITR